MIYGEFFGLKLDRRSTQLYYFITIFALCGLCDYLSAVLYVKLLPYHRKDVPPYIHIFWIVGAILYILVNMYNHLILIYDTIKEVSEFIQKRIYRSSSFQRRKSFKM